MTTASPGLNDLTRSGARESKYLAVRGPEHCPTEPAHWAIDGAPSISLRAEASALNLRLGATSRLSLLPGITADRRISRLRQ